MDLGSGLVIDQILGVSVAFYESEAGRCEAPNTAALAFTNMSVDPLLYLLLYFDGVEPGDFDARDDSESVADDTAAYTYAPNLALNTGGASYPAIAGTGSVILDGERGTAGLSLADVTFRDYEGTYGGQAALDITGVGCFVLSDSSGADGTEGDDCGWVREPADSTNAFCVEARKDFVADVLN